MIARALNAFAKWALSKNPGGFKHENDKRWAYTIGTNGSPYMTRVLLSRLLPLRKYLDVGVYLHHIHRADGDRFLHNHPWKWAFSIVLAGSYTEEKAHDRPGSSRVTYDGTPVVLRRVRWFNKITERDYHKVLELHGDVWTLFITGPHTDGHQWGFLVDGKHVSEQQFLKKAKG